MTEFDNSEINSDINDEEVAQEHMQPEIVNESENVNLDDTEDNAEVFFDEQIENTMEFSDDSYSDEDESYDNPEGEQITDDEVLDAEPDEENFASGEEKQHFVWLKSYLADKLYEFNQLSKKQKTVRTTVFLVVLVFVILVMTDIIPILPNSYHRAYVGNEHILGETVASDSKKYGDGVIYATDGKIMCFGPDMKVKKEIPGFSGTPIINTNGESAVVYGKNGNNFVVMKSIDKYKVISIDENIYSAKVNAGGGYVLLTSEAGYKSCLNAYSSSHKLIYEWHTNTNVLDMAFSDNENYIVVSTVEYNDTGVSTKLVFIETSSDRPISEYVMDNQIVSEVFFTHDNTVIAVGDISACGFTATGHQKWDISYDGKNLKTYDYDDGKIAFLFNEYNSELSESTIEIYSPSGRLRGRYDSPENVRMLSLNNDHCLLLLGKGTALLDDDADLKKTKELKEDYQKVILFDNYNFAFGIRDNIAQTISVRH